MRHPDIPVYGSASPRARTVLVFGNCQAPFVAQALGQLDDLADEFRFVTANSFVFPGESGARPVPDALVRDTAFVLVQHEDRADNPALASLLERLPAACPILRFPALLMTSPWPFECPEPRGHPEPGYFWKRFPFGDMIGLEIAGTGLFGPAAVAAYLDVSEAKMPDLRVRLQRDLERMRRQDERCDVRMADFLESRFREEHLFWVNGHVSSSGVAELARRIAAAARPVLGGSETGFEARLPAISAIGGMGGLQHPIHPLVADALGLRFWYPGMKFRWYDREWTFYEYIERYIAYDTSW